MVDTAARIAPTIPPRDWLVQLPPATRLAFHADRAARAAVLDLFPIAVEAEPCRARSEGTRASLWLGPDEYLLIAPAETGAAALAASLAERLGSLPHALVDVSHRQIGLEVRGAQAARILNGACPLDLDPAAFPVGMCTRTLLAKADVTLWRTRSDAFRLEVWRSFSAYVSELLLEIARDYP